MLAVIFFGSVATSWTIVWEDKSFSKYLKKLQTKNIDPFNAGDKITFNASEISDPDGDPLDFYWNVNSNNDLDIDLIGKEVNYIYYNPCNYTVLVYISDGISLNQSIFHVNVTEVENNNAPNASITTPYLIVPVGDKVTFYCGNSSDDDGKVVFYYFLIFFNK